MRNRVSFGAGRCVGWLLAMALGLVGCQPPPTGHPTFASPLADPLVLSADGAELYVANTAADTLDVIDTASLSVLQRIPVGIDPVGVALRPDGKELFVSNHVSDTVSVIDVDRFSLTHHQVVATITAWNAAGDVTDFDEPVGVAFASNAKAYVALSSRNRIAVIDVPSRSVTGQFQVLSQEPRALTVRDGRLFVIPFESGNQSELSGCSRLALTPGCTFRIGELVSNSIDIILTRNLVADIIRRPEIPDRDLFVYDTADETPLYEVSGLGTLLYGLAVDSQGHVFVALTEARNDANGRSGTLGDDLAEMENRAFLNQIARVDCDPDCSSAVIIDLEPAPPAHPADGTQLATPYGIQVSADDTTVVSVAAASSRLFTMDASTGQVLGSTDVGAIPRGVVLESDAAGAPDRAWVLNAVAASISLVDVSDPSRPVEIGQIALDDPTHPDVKLGRIAFNDATGSTTGTFSCASCHPDGNTDQLLWNLGARCLTPGCNQTQPRSTMPVRGLRDTIPLHWDGVVGDPFGGINAETADSGATAPANCTDEHSCFRHLVDGAMSGTMCDVSGPGSCPTDQNELGLAGGFGEAERDAMAVFLRSVPYPPARSRRLDDTFTPLAGEGFRDFLVGPDEAHPGCSRAGGCHALPFWAGTNTPGSGMDAPTFRGIPDRTLLTPNGRQALWDSMAFRSLVNEVAWDPSHGPDELFAWGMGFGSVILPAVNRNSLGGKGPFTLFQLFEEGSTGFSGSFGRQVTLDAVTTQGAAAGDTSALLARLEQADDDGVIDLRAHGLRFGNEEGPCARVDPLTGRENPSCVRATPLELVYEDRIYVPVDPEDQPIASAALVAAARADELVVTVTARIGANSDVEHPQPELWLPPKPGSAAFLQDIPELQGTERTLTLFGRHVAPDPVVLVDGQAVDAVVSCAQSGLLPECTAERLEIALAATPAVGDRKIQVGNPRGLLSNEVLLVVQP